MHGDDVAATHEFDFDDVRPAKVEPFIFATAWHHDCALAVSVGFNAHRWAIGVVEAVGIPNVDKIVAT